MRGWIAATAVLALAPACAGAADAVVAGCNVMAPGEIGIRELAGDVGDTVSVAVTIHSVDPIDSFSLDIDFPSSSLAFVRAVPGALADHFFFFGGAYLAGEDQVRLSGTDIDTPIPTGSAGVLGVVWFAVLAPGAGSFSTGDYLDDIAIYTACEDAHPPSPVDAATWGRIKSVYR